MGILRHDLRSATILVRLAAAITLGVAATLTAPGALFAEPQADDDPPAEEAVAVDPAEGDEPAAQPLDGADEPAPEPADPGATLVRGLSWDAVAGGVPKSGAIAEVRVGFPGLLTAAYHYTVQPGFSMGGLVGFDYAYYVPKAAWTSSLILAVPLRYTLLRGETMSAAVRADPGVRLVLDDVFAFGLLANVEAVIAWTIENRFVVGAALDVPLGFMIPERGTVNLTVPLLVGAVAEMHLSPPLAITFEVKMGPSFNTSGGTQFAMQILAGAAYRL